MAQMSQQLSEVLEKALALSTQELGLLIDRLIQSLDEGPAEEGVEEAWADEIKRRVDDIRTGKVEMIPGEQVLRDLARDSLSVRSERFRVLSSVISVVPRTRSGTGM